jgi:single-strand DNA-binding protein
MNIFAISGNITKDLTLRHTPKGLAVVSYSVAVNRGKEEADFIRVTRFGESAENDVKYLKRGSRVNVTGEIRSWYDKDTKKGGYEFVGYRVEYLSSGSREEQSPLTEPSGEGEDDHGNWVAGYEEGLVKGFESGVAADWLHGRK